MGTLVHEPGILTIAGWPTDPGREGLFMFDEFTGHGAYEDTALLTYGIGLQPGGRGVYARAVQGWRWEHRESHVMRELP